MSPQGYHVTIYDLGGSRSFRGIWPKYYHEVHGFIFVVDSSDAGRLAECSSVLQGMLDHHQVRGKPILLLANKSDIEHAQVRRLEHQLTIYDFCCRMRWRLFLSWTLSPW